MADGAARVPLSFVILKRTFERNVVAINLLCDRFVLELSVILNLEVTSSVQGLAIYIEWGDVKLQRCWAQKVTLTNSVEPFIL